MNAPPAILDDAPKTEPEEDRLGYNGFAKRFAASLSAIRAENGYVIGLQGPWGSGKSTVLNFVKAYLGRGDGDLVVVDFSPWLISGHQDLIAGFFKVLAEAVDFSEARNESRRRRAKRLASNAADPVFRGVGEVVAALRPEWGALAKPAANATGAALAKALAGWASEPSLQTAYANLRSALRTDRRRFVVFIDDLDRLEPEEIKAIAQMVKSVGGLPHVTYVLAYDRDIVWPALDGASNRAGKRFFADKIIQHEVSLPAPSRGALARLLDEQTSFLIADTPNSDRWSDIVRNGTQRWMRSVRDVVRLSNALAFAGPALAGELDPQDLLAMEGLRLFDDVAFTWVREHRDYLLGEGRYQFQRNEEKTEMIRRLHESLEGPAKAELVALLCTLFPTRAEELAAGGKPVLASSENYAAAAARRGVATRDGFDAYFSLSLAETSVSNRDVDALIAAIGDELAIKTMLDTYLGRRDEGGGSLIGPFLEQVHFRFQVQPPPNPTQALTSALMSMAEPIMRLDDTSSGFERRPLQYFTDLLNAVLGVAGPESAAQLLKGAIAADVTPSAAADVLVDRGREFRVFPTGGTPGRPLIAREALDELGTDVLNIILRAKTEGTLADAPRYWDILRVWKHYGDAGEARDWIRAAVSERAINLSKFALGLLVWSVGTGGRGYFLQSGPTEDDFSLQELLALCIKHHSDPALSGEDVERITALRQGLELMLRNAEEARADPDSSAD